MDTNYEGRLERIEKLTIIGWAVNSNDPAEIFNLSIYIDDVYLCNIKNDGSRKDLLKHGKSEGKGGYRVSLPPQILSNKTHKIQVKFPDNTILRTFQIPGAELLYREKRNNRIRFEELFFNYNKENIDLGNISLNQNDYSNFVGSDIFRIHQNDFLSEFYVCNLNSCAFKGSALFSGKNNAIYIGKNVKLNGTKIQIRGNNSFVIIAENCRLNNVTFSIKGDSSMIIIGAECTWESGACICDGQAILIGKDAMISNSVVIRTSDGHGIFDMTNGELINPPASVYINKHVWLGNSSRVNKGVYIGENTVLGGMSVASGNLKSNSIYAGIPAKIIKENIAWSRTYSMNDVPEEFVTVKK